MAVKESRRGRSAARCVQAVRVLSRLFFTNSIFGVSVFDYVRFTQVMDHLSRHVVWCRVWLWASGQRKRKAFAQISSGPLDKGAGPGLFSSLSPVLHWLLNALDRVLVCTFRRVVVGACSVPRFV